KCAACWRQRDQAVLRQLEQALAHQGARDAKVVGQFLLGQLGAGKQAVFDDGACQRFDNGAGGGRFHGGMIGGMAKSVYTFGLQEDRFGPSTFRRIPMGLSTHVLDTMHGCPASGMEVCMYATEGDSATLL